VAIILFGGQQSDITVFGGLLILGFAIGVFGHVIRSRTLILTGILLIGITTAYYGFAVAKVR
jgi:hypothetical protein